MRSVRHGRKVVQETVAHLGELDAAGRAKAAVLARQITGRPEQRQLFEAPPAPMETIAIRVDQVRLERSRRFGDVWLGLTLWQALRLDRPCGELLPPGREAVPWATMIAVQVFARLKHRVAVEHPIPAAGICPPHMAELISTTPSGLPERVADACSDTPRS